MKTKITFFLTLFAFITFSVHAHTWTVSNNPSSPGQFTTIQAAIDAAGIDGDTVMVAGSPNQYGDVSISKRIVLVGAGYNNPYGYGSSIYRVFFRRSNEYVSSTGTKIMGFYIQYIYFQPEYGGGTPLLNDVLIERCYFISLNFTSGYTYNNDTIRNCIILDRIGVSYNWTGQYNNIFIHNNIFSGGYFDFQGANLSAVFVRNNVFINRPNAAIFNSISNMVIENNVFYGAYPTGGSGCAFTKNIGYLCPEMPGDGNIGSGNLNNTNPQFVNFPLLGAGFDWSYDFHLQPASPGKNAGTDGTDIGIYGGMMPFNVGANPHFPQMMTLTLPNGSSVPAGGTLNVHFTARKQN